jgi:hypothetical protein
LKLKYNINTRLKINKRHGLLVVGSPMYILTNYHLFFKSHPCHSNLPVDARSLLKTKRNVSLIPMHPGEYYHFGLLNGLKGAIDKKCLPRIRNAISIEIEILINVDGLPIFSNSTSKQLWIILGIIRGIDGLEKYHFIIGIYFGLENPRGGPNTFLRAFVNDIKDVLEHGFFHCKRLFNVTALQVLFLSAILLPELLFLG